MQLPDVDPDEACVLRCLTTYKVKAAVRAIGPPRATVITGPLKATRWPGSCCRLCRGRNRPTTEKVPDLVSELEALSESHFILFFT
jgi:hypothetical protein